MAARSRARQAVAVVALALGAIGACGRGSAIPPVPSDLWRLDQREAGCIACHDGRRAPILDPSVTATPSNHPPLVVTRALRQMPGLTR